jgi:hypothetical protein
VARATRTTSVCIVVVPYIIGLRGLLPRIGWKT